MSFHWEHDDKSPQNYAAWYFYRTIAFADLVNDNVGFQISSKRES